MTERDTASRSIEMEVTIDAPVEAVWQALSTGEGMKQWFAPDAAVDGKAGGRVWLSWGAGMEGEGRIEIREPGRRLVWREGGEPPAAPLLVDFHLEGAGGSTRLRLVHSGFGSGVEWDEQFDATKAGWTYFLFHLRFWLERHRGVLRRLVSARRPTDRAAEEVWRSLLGPEGLGMGEPAPGERYRFGLGGDHWGRVELVRRPNSFAGTIATLNDGLLFNEMEPGRPTWHCGVWISLYGVAAERANALQTALDALIDERMS